MPLVTVVIPTRDRWPSLRRLLDSLAVQEAAPDFEILVIDDGSVVPPPAQLGSSPMRLFRQANAGRCASRNRGAAEAQGAILVFLDDDMEVPPSFLRDHVRAGRQGQALLCGAVRLPASYSRSAFGRFRLWLERAYEPPEAAGVADPVEIDGLTAGNMSISRDLFLQLGGFDERLTNPGCEDYEFHLRARGSGRPTFYAPRLIAIHHDEFADLRAYARRERDYVRGWMQLVALRPEVLTQAPRFASLCASNDPSLYLRLDARGARVRVKALMLDCGLLGPLHALAAGLARIEASDVALRQVYLRILALEAMAGYREGVARYLGNHAPAISSRNVADA